MMPEQFHFLRPWWLLALLPLAAVAWLMLKKKLGSRSWEAVVDPALLPYVLSDRGGGSRRVPVMLTALCGVLAIVALAGPAWDKLPQPVYSRHSALVIALDLSRSMDADDIDPSRLVRARYKIRDILKQRREGQTALIVYAGDAFTVTPLTDDTATIASQLDALNTDIMPVQGNRTDLALKHAEALLKQDGAVHGDILLITDEVDPARSRDAALRLRRDGYRVSIMGVGTSHGVPIPLPDGSFLKDKNGQIVIPVLKPGPMRQLAAAGGGLYTRMQLDDSDITQLQRLFSSTVEDRVSSTQFRTDVWRERGPWLLILLLPLAALAFRRGYALLVLCLLLPLPRPARAFDPDSLWLRSDQRAARAAEQGDHKQAAQLFRDPAWKGVEQYRSGNYDGAVKSLEKLGGAQNQYNLGNALAREGRYQAAINAYDKALKLDPGNADAKYNRKLVEDAMKKRRQQQQRQGQNQGKHKQQGDQDKDKNSPQGNNTGRQQQQQNQPQSGQKQSRPGQPGQQQQQSRQQSPPPENQPQPEPSRQQESMKQGGQKQQAGEQQSAAGKDRQQDEQQQAMEQWLRRIPDDPAGLLRRKFRYQYQQRQREDSDSDQTW